MTELPNPFLLQRVQSSRCYASKAAYSDKTQMVLYMHCLKIVKGLFQSSKSNIKTDPAEKEVKDSKPCIYNTA